MKSQLIKLYQNSSETGTINSFFDSKDEKTISLKGVSGSVAAIHASACFLNNKHLSLYILPDRESAAYFRDDLIRLIGDEYVLFFPSSYKRSVEYVKTDSTNIVLKTEVLSKISDSRKPWQIVSYPGAIMEMVIDRKALKTNTLEMSVADKLSMDFVIEVLNTYGFSRDEFVYEPGTYSVRGSIIDVFSYSSEYPVRIDFFGDTIESIRTFDAESQLSIEKINKIRIVPNIHEKLIYEKRVPFLDFISKSANIWICDGKFLIDKIEHTYNAALNRYKENLLDDSEIVVNPKTHLNNANDILQQLSEYSVAEWGQHLLFKEANELNINTLPQPAFGKNFDLLAQDIIQKKEEGFTHYILAENEKQIQRIQEILITKNDSISFVPGNFVLHEGFIDYNKRICVYTDHQLFERFHRFKVKKAFARKDAISLQELNALRQGDYVVHIDNGVGKFGGLTTIENNGKMQEVVSIMYGDNDVLFVNIHSLHRISKYRSKDDEPPKVHRLGSGHWKRLKEKTKSRVKDIAKELILLYAQRKDQDGFAFSPDSYLQQELESSFIYEETPDQEKALEAVKTDMESSIPMDRLICGDVGFGKTEVAIRAAFKAVCDSKQVAVLVPTTILALQHFETFKERLRGLPVSIDYISRLRTSAENKLVLDKLKERNLDIIIGTHKLVSNSIIFKDLGLLIIDEEQKFGVAVKEKLKKIKLNVDTLTMTATPIPRTLQFSLMGARDLSIINTPPPNRQPIITELHTFNADIIREAIYYEVNRNGQVFFVNNRIQNIYEIQTLIARQCPDVTTAVAHGQMDGATLEKVVLGFMRGDFDVLISTAIIENGVDIPNANTIIINNANNFGLSDLHQLRGRVGRSNKKAFCYLLAPPLNMMTSDARRRLRAIEEHSELGSGFNIALQDLDIRGAGDILGADQSGFIANIGFETYNKILNEALQELKENELKSFYAEQTENEQTEKTYIDDCSIDTDFPVMLPAEYVQSTSERINLYRQLDDINDETKLLEFTEKLIDRFGKPPQEVMELLNVVRLRRTGIKLGFQKIVIKNGLFIAYFPLNQQSNYYNSKVFASIIRYVQNNPHQLQIKETNNKLSLRFKGGKHIRDYLEFLSRIYFSINNID
ncbi:MAG TPA: transcription-repair coupling factor [Bacteroidales bacterium]|nr:transcription-repair coupling factor [Bacteroidales bacterium]